MIRIVRIDGNQYQVPKEHDEQTVRSSLVQAGFTNANNAKLEKGTIEIDGQEYELWDFVKKAGMKG
jgi:hypothetical protein